jgi:hypothetical protein
MRNKINSQNGVSSLRLLGALALAGAALSFVVFGFAAAPPEPAQSAAVTTAPTFGHPVIAGINGNGFEVDLRVDPSNANRIYESAPGSLSSDTSWIWRSLDAGKTFKWVPGSTPLTGKAQVCAGGGDTELGVDVNGHVYFADLTLANFSTGRSDNQGATWTCSNTGVPDTVVDRQWYAFDGDPTNGGAIYLANDEVAQAPAQCGSSATNFGQNVLVMYRSPIAGQSTTAGIQFGPAAKVSDPLGCAEGIMGNNEVSPVATTTGQPVGAAKFFTLPAPVKHVYVIHDDALFSKVMIGRCFPVAFGPPVPNVSDPSGLNCTDILVADLGTTQKTGGSFATMAIDKGGNLYAVWEQAPIDANGNITGDTVLKYSYSSDEGNSWSKPMTIDTSGSPVGTLHNNVMAWIAAGDDGRVGIAWYGTPGAPKYSDPAQNHGPDSCPVTCDWSLWYVMSTNAHAATPSFTAPIQASEHFIHRGSIQTVLGGQNGDRTLGDFLQLRLGASGEAEMSYGDSNNIDEVFAPHAMFVRQNGGDTLYAANSPANIAGIAPFNSVSDPTGDGRYEANGTVSDNMPQLDITGSSVQLVGTTANTTCTDAAPCYKIVMQLNDLSISPNTAQDPDTDLVWMTQWLVPSTSDPNGGKNFIAYAESNNGGAIQCFTGENAANAVGGGVALTYPGANAIDAKNCQAKTGPNGTITMYVPLAAVKEDNPIDNKLHEVTATTLTMQGPANAVPSLGGVGGSFFNEIDAAQSYVFDPTFTTTQPAVQLLNISGRADVQAADKIADGGFIVKGTGNKRVLMRGIGPSLSSGGQPVNGRLDDPVIELHDASGATIAVNDNWRATQQDEIQQTGLAPTDDRESALIASLAPGNYTAILRGANGGTGIGLVEIYDLEPQSGSEFANLSVRADVETDDNVLIDGVILGGVAPKRILFRALGPSLTSSGQPVQGRLTDPTMELHDVNGALLATNDNWRDASNASDIQAVLPPPDDHESAILVTLGPGNYTSVVRGVNNATGIALNEVYKVDQ